MEASMFTRSLLLLVFIVCSVGAFAQDPTPPQPGTKKTPVINERQKNQRARIRQGVQSGELTKGEARKLRQEQKTIQAEKQMAKADGKVTPAERAQMRKDQNKASRDIYRLKHNNRTAVDQPDKK
jgi:hypothetical protein